MFSFATKLLEGSGSTMRCYCKEGEEREREREREIFSIKKFNKIPQRTTCAVLCTGKKVLRKSVFQGFCFELTGVPGYKLHKQGKIDA